MKSFKTCIICREKKDESNFYRDSGVNRKTVCSECLIKRSRKYKKAWKKENRNIDNCNELVGWNSYNEIYC